MSIYAEHKKLCINTRFLLYNEVLLVLVLTFKSDNFFITSIYADNYCPFSNRGIIKRLDCERELQSVYNKVIFNYRYCISSFKSFAIFSPQNSFTISNPKSAAAPAPLAVKILPSSTAFLSDKIPSEQYCSKPGKHV